MFCRPCGLYRSFPSMETTTTTVNIQPCILQPYTRMDGQTSTAFTSIQRIIISEIITHSRSPIHIIPIRVVWL